ncbi:MAG: tRNA (N6-threonylcarbamoyladenosine(37)-N6)-methyltransferase TrmO [Gammaproteobacteria bacterium]|nr:tRNA (N6-threonylcarbamoyladenosine(37)-N6)-methyltransferase TrmO [Gammaproteobacteria bacterium]
MTYPFDPIAILHSPFKQKFGVPRQSGLVQINSTLELLPPYNRREALTAIEGYSHLWLLFVFHQTQQRSEWQPMVRPPRLGGNRRVGVFASRSPFRPNPIGLSVVKLESVDCSGDKVQLLLSGADLVDGTPVIDIKPYVPYVDSIPDAAAGFAPAPPESRMEVYFSVAAEQAINVRAEPGLREIIVSVLSLDPRPAYKEGAESDRIYGMRLYDFDLQWQIQNNRVEVLGLEVPKEGS